MFRSVRFRTYLALAVATVFLASFADAQAVLAGDLDNVAQFDIPAQPLDKALLQFGAQAHVQIMFAWNSSTGRMQAREIIGRYSGRAALAILLRGTGLGYSQHGNTIAVI
ncbi:MAG: STN domain-containing protein, partial [Chloroflexota bacterium]